MRRFLLLNYLAAQAAFDWSTTIPDWTSEDTKCTIKRNPSTNKHTCVLLDNIVTCSSTPVKERMRSETRSQSLCGSLLEWHANHQYVIAAGHSHVTVEDDNYRFDPAVDLEELDASIDMCSPSKSVDSFDRVDRNIRAIQYFWDIYTFADHSSQTSLNIVSQRRQINAPVQDYLRTVDGFLSYLAEASVCPSDPPLQHRVTFAPTKGTFYHGRFSVNQLFFDEDGAELPALPIDTFDYKVTGALPVDICVMLSCVSDQTTTNDRTSADLTPNIFVD